MLGNFRILGLPLLMMLVAIAACTGGSEEESALPTVGGICAERADLTPHAESKDRLAFSDPDGIWTVDPDGSNPTLLAEGSFPKWSPDGSKIAFLDRDQKVMNADGTDVTQLASSPRGLLLGWSPNGQCLAVLSEPSSREEPYESYVVSLDGSFRVALEDPSKNSFSWFPIMGFMQSPWSSDGTRVGFVSGRSKLEVGMVTADPAGMEIGVVNSDGTNRRVLTSDGGFKMFAGWAPGSDLIAFIHTDPEAFASGSALPGIYVMADDGSSRKRIADWPSEVLGGLPVWSPDGERLAFWSGIDGLSSLFVVDADGSNLTPVTTGGNCDGRLGISWSPDGQRLAFVRSCEAPYFSSDQEASLWVVGSDGSDLIRLVGGVEEGLEPAWSPVR